MGPGWHQLHCAAPALPACSQFDTGVETVADGSAAVTRCGAPGWVTRNPAIIQPQAGRGNPVHLRCIQTSSHTNMYIILSWTAEH